MDECTMIGKLFAESRIKKGLSQEVVSGFAVIARTHLSDIERGIRKPTMTTFFKVCRALRIKPSEVMRKMEERLPFDF